MDRFSKALLAAVALAIGIWVLSQGPGAQQTDVSAVRSEARRKLDNGGSVMRADPAPASFFLPDKSDYLRQVHEDPHHTPQVLRQFGARMALRMQSALGSPLGAVSVFEELRACASSDEGIEAAQAICAVNAARLAQRYPKELASAYDELWTKLSIAVRDSVRASGF